MYSTHNQKNSVAAKIFTRTLKKTSISLRQQHQNICVLINKTI